MHELKRKLLNVRSDHGYDKRRAVHCYVELYSGEDEILCGQNILWFWEYTDDPITCKKCLAKMSEVHQPNKT